MGLLLDDFRLYTLTPFISANISSDLIKYNEDLSSVETISLEEVFDKPLILSDNCEFIFGQSDNQYVCVYDIDNKSIVFKGHSIAQ